MLLLRQNMSIFVIFFCLLYPYDPGNYLVVFGNFGSQLISDMLIFLRCILILCISCIAPFYINVHCNIYLLDQRHKYVLVFILRDTSQTILKLHHAVYL